MHLIDYEDLVATHLRRNSRLFHELLDILHRVVGSRIKLKDIIRALFKESFAALANATGLTICSGILTVYCSCENSRTSGLSHPTRTAEKESVCKFSASHRIFQRCGESFLSHHSVECQRSIFSCRYLVFHSFLLNCFFYVGFIHFSSSLVDRNLLSESSPPFADKMKNIYVTAKVQKKLISSP